MQPEYSSIVGKILYFLKKVSPLCANAARKLSQHLENPGVDHWKAVQRLLGFLQDEDSCKIRMRAPRMELRVLSACNTDYDTSKVDRRRVGVILNTIGCSLLHWLSKGHPSVTLSSTEAEYVEMTNVVKEVSFIQMLLSEIATNMGAIFLITNSQVGMQTKKIDVCYHCLRDKVADCSISFQYDRSEDDPSNLLTKQGLLQVMIR